jgi:pimeloyl-ACP methyl ester carboxylesterase
MSEHAHVDGIYPFPAVMRTRTIETNGTSIHVRVGGHGPAVVMLHGFGTTGDMWGHLATALIVGWASRRSLIAAMTRRIRRRT